MKIDEPEKIFRPCLRILFLLFFLICLQRAAAGVFVTQGDRALKSRDFNSCLEKYSLAARIDPLDPKSNLEGSQCALEAGIQGRNLDAVLTARRGFERAVRELPFHGKAWFYLAKTKLALSKLKKDGKAQGLFFDEIIKDFERAKSLEAGNPWLSCQIGLLLIEFGGEDREIFSRAIEELKHGLSVHYFDHPSPYLQAAVQKLWTLARDLAVIESVVPEDYPSYRVFMKFLEEKNLRPERSKRELKARGLQKKYYEIKCQQGREALEKGLNELALRRYQEAYWTEKSWTPAKEGMLNSARRLGRSFEEESKFLEELKRGS